MKYRVHRSRCSFTLVELMVVIVFVGILVTLALQQYTGAKKQSLRQEAVTYAHQIRGAVWRYIEEEDAFPSSFSDLDVEVSTQWTCSFSGDETSFTVTAIKTTDPCVKATMDDAGNVTSVQYTCS